MQNREYIVFEQTRDTESTSHVRVCESCAHYIFNQLAGGYVVVQFYPWFKFSFLLFQTHYHVIIIHYHTQKQKKRKFEPQQIFICIKGDSCRIWLLEQCGKIYCFFEAK